jgi:hypothetical protein
MNYDKDVGLQFLKDMGLLPSSMVCSVCGCHMCVGASVKDGSVGEMGGKHLLPDTTFLGLSGTVHIYTHHTVNDTIAFVHERTKCHTKTIESTWSHVKAFINAYNRKSDYTHHLAYYWYIFSARYCSRPSQVRLYFIRDAPTIRSFHCPLFCNSKLLKMDPAPWSSS